MARRYGHGRGLTTPRLTLCELRELTWTTLRAASTSHVLRAILGVRPDVSTLAVHRELGWMQLKDVIANAKLTLAHSILRMGAHRLPKKILLSRAGELTWAAGAPPAMAHGSLVLSSER
jgi:hypothetical protein